MAVSDNETGKVERSPTATCDPRFLHRFRNNMPKTLKGTKNTLKTQKNKTARKKVFQGHGQNTSLRAVLFFWFVCFFWYLTAFLPHLARFIVADGHAESSAPDLFSLSLTAMLSRVHRISFDLAQIEKPRPSPTPALTRP